MKFLVIFLLLLCKNIFANTIFESNQLSNIEYIEKHEGLKSFDFSPYIENRIFFMYAYDDIVAGKNKNIKCNQLNFNLEKFNLLINSIKKYNLKFLKKINLNYIVLCENLKINNYLAAGFANSNVSTLMIDFTINKNMLERVVHHEIFHMITANYDTKNFNEKWLNQNNTNFNYKNCLNCQLIHNTDLSFENNGFLSKYSMYSLNEDQAEVFSFWMMKDITIDKIIKDDKILKNKVKILKNFLKTTDFRK